MIKFILNQEADEIAYRCAFACERQGYIFHGKKNKVDLGNKYTKTQIKTFFSNKGKTIDVDYTLEPYKIIENEKTVIVTLDAMIKRLRATEIEYKRKWHRVHDIRLWLSPSDHSNFRYSIVNTAGPKGLGYKAGRPEKPVHLAMIRDRLLKVYDAEEIPGYEADDALGMYQTEETVASHIDKDINMIPGHHFNHVTGEYYFTPFDSFGSLELNEKRKLVGLGTIFFYAQLLMGDPTDNIPGIKKLGPVKAYDLLNLTEEDEAFTIVYDEYVTFYGKDSAQSILEEVADLIWICRKDGETGREYLKNRGYL